MGIDISCTRCGFQERTCSASRKQLLDALREYLKEKNRTAVREQEKVEAFHQILEDRGTKKQLTLPHDVEDIIGTFLGTSSLRIETAIQLKYVNWMYRDDSDDADRVLTMTEDEKNNARSLLKKNNLDGLFCWIFLQEGDYISTYTAEKFKETFQIVQNFVQGRFLDLNILKHAINKQHSLESW